MKKVEVKDHEKATEKIPARISLGIKPRENPLRIPDAVSEINREKSRKRGSLKGFQRRIKAFQGSS